MNKKDKLNYERNLGIIETISSHFIEYKTLGVERFDEIIKEFGELQ